MSAPRYFAFIATCAIWACAAAQQPLDATDMPESWHYDSPYIQTDPTADQWWSLFHDQTLDSLISVALTNNYDLLQAARRINMAHAALQQARSAYYPQIQAEAQWNKSHTSGRVTADPSSEVSSFTAGLSASWEVDVFGKITTAAKGKKAAEQVAKAERDAAEVAIAAQVAKAYMQLRTMQSEANVIDANIATQKRVLEITEARYEAGLSSKLDVAQARTTYLSTQASKINVETSIRSTINAIAVLTGQMPGESAQWLAVAAPMPDYRQIVAAGTPAELLRRRPDIVEAERQLAVYAAQLGVAKKDFLPTLALQGSIGTQAHKLGDLFGDHSMYWSVTPTLTWTLFDGLSRRASMVSAREQMRIGIDNYNATVLAAAQEVDNAITSYLGALRYIEIAEQALHTANEAFSLSIDLYKQGLTSFINVQNSQISALHYANQLVEARGDALTALVSLYEALGGGY